MTSFGLNVLLAIAWIALTGTVTLANFVIGALLGYVVICVIQPMLGPSRYPARALAWGRLLPLFLWELLISSIEVARDILRPRSHAHPAILEMPLTVRSDEGILLVTNLISLTTGTLSLDVSEDRKTLTIHAMFASDPEALIASLKSGIERWVIDAVEDFT